MAKLTLSIDDSVVARARQYAKSRGLSVSEMVEAYLSAVSKPVVPRSGDAPILRFLRGILKHADMDDYKKHLATKSR